MLFNRQGQPHQPTGHTEAGKPFRAYRSACPRCGGAGGSRAWDHTGWTCYDCGGSGLGMVHTEQLYTAEENAKLDAALAKRNATAAAKRAVELAAENARVATFAADFKAENSAFLAKLDVLVDKLDREGDTFWSDFRQSVLRRQVEPSARQIEVAENGMVRLEARIKQAAQRKASRPVGIVGARVELELTCEKIIDVSYGEFPRIYSYLHLCRDAQGNRVVYKGAGSFLAEGETGVVKATVKSHDEYKGEQQTFIQRPKVAQGASQ